MQKGEPLESIVAIKIMTAKVKTKEENGNVANLKVSDSVIKIFSEWFPTDCDMTLNLERLIVRYFNIKNSRQLKKVRNEWKKFHLITDEKKYMIELLTKYDDEAYLSITEDEDIVVYRIRIGAFGYYYAEFMEITTTIDNYIFAIDREASGKVLSKDGEIIIEIQYHTTYQGKARYDLDEINNFIEYYSRIAHNPNLYMQTYKKMSNLFHYLGEYLILDIYSDNKKVKTIDFTSETVKITLYMNNEEDYYLEYNFQEDKAYTIGYSNPVIDICICYGRGRDAGKDKIKLTGSYNSNEVYLYCNKKFIKLKENIAIQLLESEKRNY